MTRKCQYPPPTKNHSNKSSKRPLAKTSEIKTRHLLTMVRRNNNNRLLSRIMTVRKRKMCRNRKMMLRTRRRTSLNLSRKRSRIARRRTIQTMRGQRLRQMYMAVVLRTPNSSAYCIKVGQLPGHRLTGNNRCSNRRICRICG